MRNYWIIVGSSLLALAVILGAFGAHMLKGHLDAYGVSIWEKASFYHFIHALGILIIGVLKEQWLDNSKVGSKVPFKIADRLGALLLGGITLFSGSLYLLAVTNIKWLGAITPLGGSAFIFAWCYLAFAAYRTETTSHRE